MKPKLTLLILFLLPLLTWAQVSFEAYADVRQVVMNGYFDVTFTLRNADGDSFSPPSFDNFEVLAGPSRSMSTTILNGKVSKELGYSYTLMPLRVGKFTIGSASIKVNGRTLRTKPIAIEVLQGKELSDANPANKVFLKAELSPEQAIVGQQVTLDYKLYTAVDIDSYSILEESDYQGFFAQDLRRFDTPPRREVIKGMTYVSKILKRIALFPQQAGQLTVSPLKMELAVLLEDPGRRNGFFFNRAVQRLIAETDPITINVATLPPSPPAAFTGAVGNFEASYTISRTEASTDDVLSLRLVITGDGDIKRVQPPALTLSDSFEVYDPRVLEETTYETAGGALTARKEIEYLIQPKFAGIYHLQPTFAYYNPDSGRYVLLDQQSFDLNILQGALRPNEVNLNGKTADKPQDIHFIKLDTKLHRPRSAFFGTGAFWVFTLLPFLLFGGVIVIKRWQDRRGNEDSNQLKIKRARQEALRHLQVAETHLHTNQVRAFFDEVSKALLGYVCDKLQIPRSALTKDSVREKLHSLSVEEGLIDNFMKIIQTCEMALYSGADTPAAMHETYRQALENISKIEEFVGK